MEIKTNCLEKILWLVIIAKLLNCKYKVFIDFKTSVNFIVVNI